MLHKLDILKKIVLFVTFMVFACSFAAYAGDINGNEQRLIPVMNGTFEKDGVTYRAKQEYIDAAISYLQADDVDLSAEQVDHYINKVYASVQQGIDEGYLYAVSEPPAPTAAAETSASGNEEPSKNQGQPAETSPSEESEESEEPGESEESDTAETAAESQETEIEEEVPAVVRLLEAEDPASSFVPDYGRDTDAWMEQMHMPYQLIFYLILALAAVIIVTALTGWSKKLFHTAHHHKLRAGLRVAAGAVYAVSLCGVLALGTVLLTTMPVHKIMERMEKSGYSSDVYDELELSILGLLGYLDLPDTIKNDSISYEKVTLAVRQQAEAGVQGQSYETDVRSAVAPLKRNMEKYLSDQEISLTPEAEDGLNARVDGIAARYKELLEWPYTVWASENRQICESSLVTDTIMLAVLAIISCLLIVYLHYFRHRGFRTCAVLTSIVSILWLAGLFAGKQAGFLFPESMEPEHMYKFFELYAEDIYQTGFMLGIAGLGLALIYGAAVKMKKERMMES